MRQHIIKLVGTRNSKYRLLKQKLEKSIQSISLNISLIEINKVEDMLTYPLSSIPAILIDEKIIFDNGYAPNQEELTKNILKQLTKAMPMKNIIVPIDFSEASQHAYLFAQQLAEQTESQIKLIHFAPIYLDASMPEINNIDFLLDNAQQQLELFMNENTLTNNGETKVKVSAEAKIGFAADGILQCCKEDVDLLIMGTTGSSGWLRKLFGSVSIKVAKEATCPVLLIPPKAKFRGFDEILFTNSQTDLEENIKVQIAQLCEQFDAFAHVVHVEEQEAEFKLNRIAIEILDDRTSFRAVDIIGNSIVEVINQYIEHHAIDLSVVTTQHRNLIDDLFHKSITKQMVMNTEIPLLILHSNK